MGKGTKDYVDNKHSELAKKMVAAGEHSLHHEMSVLLQATRTIYEFNDVVDRYLAIRLEQEGTDGNG